MSKRTPTDGKDLMLWVDGKCIALAKSCKLSISGEQMDASSKDDGIWKADDVSSLSWQITSDGLASMSGAKQADIDMSFALLKKKMIARETVTITMGLTGTTNSTGVPSTGWTEPVKDTEASVISQSAVEGLAVITSIELTGEKGSAASMSITLDGYGELSDIA